VDFEPGDVFLTVTDVFVLLLPGGILVAGAAWIFWPDQVANFSGSATAWTLLLVGSYVVGTLVSGLSSIVEDWLSHRPGGEKQIDNEFSELRANVTSTLKTVFSESLTKHDVRRVAGLFVQMRSGALSTTLGRRDADRRFFRNLILVAAIDGTLAIAQTTAVSLHAPWRIVATAIVVIVAMALLVLTYTKLDRKYTRDAFDYFLVLNHLDPFVHGVKGTDPQQRRATSEPTAKGS